MERSMKALLASIIAIAVVAVSVPAPAADKAYLDAQAAYLSKNLKKKGRKVTKSGLEYHPLKKVKNGQKPKSSASVVTVNYEGKFIDGKVFDSSYARKQPMSFPLDQVIEGWTEGVGMM